MSLQPPKLCVYCGTGKPSKEHIFGDWMKDHVQTNETRTVHHTSYMGLDQGIVPTVGFRPKLNREGAPHRVQLKIACEKCNSGWMNHLQDNAKPLLIELINARWPIISEDHLGHLARWATMVTMSLEFADLKTVTTTADDRLAFKEHAVNNPPYNWQVYLGLGGDAWSTGAFWHRSLLVFDGNATNAIGKRPNMQVTTFHIGRSFFHTISGPADMTPNPELYAFDLGIKQIWPLPVVVPQAPTILLNLGVARASTKFFIDAGIDARPHQGLIL
ncbi:hypothetical protein AAFG22_14745 [Bradyrhizobium sp. B024]|uniref:hypothetical protein n=1 Tax=Bradyrhizobium sp. B024 TaxID=3140247 RepID=UPI003183D922